MVTARPIARDCVLLRYRVLGAGRSGTARTPRSDNLHDRREIHMESPGGTPR
jgi:hypothetical protein